MRNIVLIINNIRSAHNVGAILRTSEGMGVDKIIFSGYSPYPKINGDTRLPHISKKLTDRISKTSLGAEKLLKLSYAEDIYKEIAKLKKQNYQIISLEQSKTAIDIKNYSPTNKIVLILGNELDGVEKDLLLLSNEIIEIPMLGEKESYNVASSAAIALYHMRFSE